ncbi:hypothetical protein ACMHYB_04800 [Sorangium sp. So ce1128]
MQVATTPITSITASDVRGLLASGAGSGLLSGADLFTLAFALSGRSHQQPLTLDEAYDLLLANGLPQALAGDEFIERMRDATSADPAFLVYNAWTFCIDRNVGLARRLGQIVFRHDVQQLLRVHRAEPPPQERPAARAPARARRTEAPDLPYNPMLIEQRIGRLHRMGQREEVRVYNLCARGTAEERVLDLLDRRLHLFELVVGEMDMVLGNMADERDLEERIVSLYATSRSEEELASGFDAIAEELAAARGRYEQVKRLDARLFGKDYEA